MNFDDADLPPPPRFAPYLLGKYTTSAGLSQLGDQPAIWVDSDYSKTINLKDQQLEREYEKYVRFEGFDDDTSRAASKLLATTAARDCPKRFNLIDLQLITQRATIDLNDSNAFDLICRNLQEDVVVIRRQGDRDWNAAIHLCFPNGWSPAEKIGQSFFKTHEPVAGIEAVNARAAHWVSMMINARAGLVRYVWGIRTDDYLDHHPESPSLPWNPDDPHAWVRVERQTIFGFPRYDAAVFLIRTYLYPCEALTTHERSQLATAIEGMSDASAEYKGLTKIRSELVRFIRAIDENLI